MFVPNIDQESINQRATDIENLRKRFEAFSKQIIVKIKTLENVNVGLVNKNTEYEKVLGEFQDNMKNMGTKIFDLLANDIEFEKKFEDIYQQLSVLKNQKIDLAGKIMAAKKRLDGTKKA